MSLINHKSPTAGRRINEERAKAINAEFFWLSKSATFQTDVNSLALITGRVAKIQAKSVLGEAMPDFTWRAADDIDHLFKPTEFLQFAVAVDDWVEAQYTDSWAKKAAL